MPEWVRIEQVFTDVVAIRPVYTDTGKATEVITRNGKVGLDPRDVRSVRRALFRCHQIDPQAQKALVKKLVGKDISLPFYLDPDRVFIPFKMRQPKIERDRVYGYVDLNFIARIDQTPEQGCRLILTSGSAIKLCCTRDTAAKSYERGIRLAKSLQEDEEKSRDLGAMVLGAVTSIAQLMVEMYRSMQWIERAIHLLLPHEAE